MIPAIYIFWQKPLVFVVVVIVLVFVVVDYFLPGGRKKQKQLNRNSCSTVFVLFDHPLYLYRLLLLRSPLSFPKEDKNARRFAASI